MKFWNILFCHVAAFLMSVTVSDAQDIRQMFAKIRQQADTSCMVLKYVFTTSAGDAVVTDEGFVEAQGNMWHLKGQSLEIFTDGASTWVLDNEAKEVIVEPGWSYDDLETFYTSVIRNGTDVDIDVVSETVTERKPATFFTPSFDSSWVVTDLR